MTLNSVFLVKITSILIQICTYRAHKYFFVLEKTIPTNEKVPKKNPLGIKNQNKRNEKVGFYLAYLYNI